VGDEEVIEHEHDRAEQRGRAGDSEALTPDPSPNLGEGQGRGLIDESDVPAALETLKQHDVVEQSGDKWRYRVELMRRWVESKI
jgi:hypothetical protein